MRSSQGLELNVTNDITDLINSLDNIKELYKKIIDEYSKQMKEVDCKQQDILHFIEFKNVNSVAGFRILKELQKVRRKRRNIEDILDLLNRIQKTSAISNPTKAKDVLNNKVTSMKTRRYKERVYSEDELNSIANLPEYIKKDIDI